MGSEEGSSVEESGFAIQAVALGVDLPLQPCVATLVEPTGALASTQVGEDSVDALVHHGVALVLAIAPLLVGVGAETAERIVAGPYASPVLPIGVGAALVTTHRGVGLIVVAQSRSEDVNKRLVPTACAKVGRPSHVIANIPEVVVVLVDHVLGSGIDGGRIGTHLRIEVVAPEGRPPLTLIMIGRSSVFLGEGMQLGRLLQVGVFGMEIVGELKARPLHELAGMALHVDIVIVIFQDSLALLVDHGDAQHITRPVGIHGIVGDLIGSRSHGAAHGVVFVLIRGGIHRGLEPAIAHTLIVVGVDDLATQRNFVALVHLDEVLLHRPLIVLLHERSHQPAIGLTATPHKLGLVSGDTLSRSGSGDRNMDMEKHRVLAIHQALYDGEACALRGQFAMRNIKGGLVPEHQCGALGGTVGGHPAEVEPMALLATGEARCVGGAEPLLARRGLVARHEVRGGWVGYANGRAEQGGMHRTYGGGRGIHRARDGEIEVVTVAGKACQAHQRQQERNNR